MKSRQENNPMSNIEKSPMKEAYLLLHARTPLELSNLYAEEDQKLMRSSSWDYDNPALVVNKVKDILEVVNPQELTEEEKEWKQEILWYWYHHAISCAIWRYKDKQAAKNMAAKALELQGVNHPNNITKLLYLLVNDRLEEAEKWAEGIKEEPEKTTAAHTIQEYKDGGFF